MTEVHRPAASTPRPGWCSSTRRRPPAACASTRRSSTSTTSRPRRCFGGEGGLWLAAVLAGGDRAHRAHRGVGPVDPAVARPRDRARELPARPDVQHTRTGDAVPRRRPARLDARQRRARVGRARCDRSAEIVYGWAEAHAKGEPVRGQARRAQPRDRDDRLRVARRRRRLAASCCAPTGSSTPSRTASSAATSCASRCSPRSSPTTSPSSPAPSTTSSSGRSTASRRLPDGLVAVVKRDCPTCRLVAPVLADLADGAARRHRLLAGRPDFPGGVAVVDDTDLEVSFRLEIETVPTLLRVAGGEIVARTEGLDCARNGRSSPASAPLGRRAARVPARLRLAHARPDIAAARADARRRRPLPRAARRARRATRTTPRRCSNGAGPTACPSCRRRRSASLRMLAGTTREPDEVVAVVPPDLVECTVEKVAINAVMAGCKPEYLPVVLAAVEAACTDEFNIHGLLRHDVVLAARVVDRQRPDPARDRHELGQSTRSVRATAPTRPSAARCSSSIRNVGGGRPGEVDRATLGNPGKYTFCFAEDEAGSPWEPLHVERGLRARHSTRSRCSPAKACAASSTSCRRTPESLARSLAALPADGRASEAGARCSTRCSSSRPSTAACSVRRAGRRPASARSSTRSLQLDGRRRSIRGAGGIAEGLPEAVRRRRRCPSSATAGSCIVHAGGGAGLFSAIIGGWASGRGRKPARHPGGEDVSARSERRVLLDPTAEREAPARERAPRPASLDGRTVGLLDISKPRGDVFLDRLEEQLAGRGLQVRALREADVLEAGADRPAPRDRARNATW